MPVPMVAPMPIVVSWNSPIERSSSPPPVSVPVSRRQLGDRLPAQRLLEK